MIYYVTVGGREFQVEVDGAEVLLDGEAIAAEFEGLPTTGVRSLLLDGESHTLISRQARKGLWRIHLDGRELSVEVLDGRMKKIREMSGSAADGIAIRPLQAPMPGLIVQVEVQEGDIVSPGQGLVIIEAMKMENELRSAIGARVSKILVDAGQPVEKDQVLIEFEEP